jgi:hypothetical protein
MAHSLIQRRLEAERARVEAYEASLRRVSQPARPAPSFETAIVEAKRGFEADVLRDARAWRPQMKTRDVARLRLAAARYLFARYAVAEHLEQIWIDCSGLAPAEIILRKRWYIVAAGGGSLHRKEAGAWLSRKEVHAFLNPPPHLGFEAAIWQAIARSYSNDPAIALRIARSRIAQTPRAELGFWREVVRFFCAHPTTVEEMDDLRDYLADCRRRNPEFGLKGRTPRRRPHGPDFDDRARPSVPGDPGSGIRQPHATYRGAKAPGALGQGARDRPPIASPPPPGGAGYPGRRGRSHCEVGTRQSRSDSCGSAIACDGVDWRARKDSQRKRA